MGSPLQIANNLVPPHQKKRFFKNKQYTASTMAWVGNLRHLDRDILLV